MRQTNLMILIAIQLFCLSTKSSNRRGASGKKSRGLRHPSSHVTFIIAAVTLGSSWSSMSISLIFGQDGRKTLGYDRARRYNVTTVFLRMFGLEWLRRGSKSAIRDMAREVVTTCGSVIKGREIVGTEIDVMS